MHRVFEILDTEVPPDGTYTPSEPATGNIQIKDLSFSYPDSAGHTQNVLSNLNMEIHPGK